MSATPGTRTTRAVARAHSWLVRHRLIAALLPLALALFLAACDSGSGGGKSGY